MRETLLVERDDRDVVTLTLHRPEVRNALNPELMEALRSALTELADDPTLRAVVLTGAGDVFCAGADLHWMLGSRDASLEEGMEDSRRFEAMLRAARTFPAPLLARVNGHAIAGASGLVACTDIAVAVRGARFGFTEARLGIVPAMISAYAQPRIGVANARRFFLTGELFDADRALAMGLVHEVCERDELDTTFGAVLDGVLAAGREAQREVKRLIDAVAATPDPADSEQLRVESIARARAGDEAQARISAFLASRRS